ncbi:glycosyl hydrolase family protein, partial [Pseudomonas syringae pv. actinidiae ICMP 19070]
MADRPQEAQNRIEDHGIIGDMRSAALIADTGSIDFCCWPD